MGLLIRERPRLALSVHVDLGGTSPGVRYGADDMNVQNVPNALTFSTAMPGGFDQCTLTLERDPRINWPDFKDFATVTVTGLGGSQVAWQGRIEEFPSQAGSQSNFTPTITGWQANLQDNTAAAVIFIDRNLSAWQAPTKQTTIENINNGYGVSQWSGAPSIDSNAVPEMLFTATLPIVGDQVGQMWYQSSGGLIASLRGSNILLTCPGGWPATGSSLNTYIVSDPLSTQSESEGWNAGSSFIFTPSTPLLYAVLGVLNASGTFGTSGQTGYVGFEDVAVIGNHGLEIQLGPSGVTPGGDDGFLASQMVGYVLEQFCPQLRYNASTIAASSFVIPQAVFAPGTPLSIIQNVTQYELLDYAVWEAGEGTTGPTFYMNPRGARGKQWVARVGDAQLQNAGTQSSTIYNGVVVSYTDVTGVTNTVGPPGSNAFATSSALADSDPQNPANIAGINRWYLLSIGTSTQAAAIQVGQIFLQEQAQVNTSGQATLVGHVQDTHGNYWPAWMIRAGDTIAFLDAADSSPRRVVSTSYDDASVTNTVQLDSPPDSMTALLARLSAVVAPLGF